MTTELANISNRTPEQTDRQLRSLASSLNVALTSGSSLKPKYDDKGVFLGSELVPGVISASGSEQDLATVADAIVGTLAPAPRESIENWIAELSVLAPSRADDGMTAALKLEAYTRRLSDHPADMVHHVLLGRTWRFFPSWYELEQELKAMRRERDAMLSACCSTRPDEPSDDDQRERISADRAAEIMAEIGFAPKRPG